MLTIIFYHASSSFSTDLYFSIPEVITQIFNPTAELAIPIGMPTKEAEVEMEMHPVIVEIKISAQYNSKLSKLFYVSYSLINFDWFPQFNNFLFNLQFPV